MQEAVEGVLKFQNQPGINGDERQIAPMNCERVAFKGNESLFITVHLR
jgi:hypothetical protein